MYNKQENNQMGVREDQLCLKFIEIPWQKLKLSASDVRDLDSPLRSTLHLSN